MDVALSCRTLVRHFVILLLSLPESWDPIISGPRGPSLAISHAASGSWYNQVLEGVEAVG